MDPRNPTERAVISAQDLEISAKNEAAFRRMREDRERADFGGLKGERYREHIRRMYWALGDKKEVARLVGCTVGTVNRAVRGKR